MNEKLHSPILITGVERSGSTFIAQILSLCGGYSGKVSKMYENIELKKQMTDVLQGHLIMDVMKGNDQVKVPELWDDVITDIIINEGYTGDVPWYFKSSKITPLWKEWKETFPHAKWIIVRRRPPDIINSCMKTAYMTLFKNIEIRKMFSLETESDGWAWWISLYQDLFLQMVRSGIDYKEVYPERMRDGDYSQVQELVEWTGLNWNYEIPNIINPLIKEKKGK